MLLWEIQYIGNTQDIYAVAVLKSGVVVGHLPRKISSICSLFLRCGGRIHCTVTAARRYSADLEQGGLEVPCILKFEGCSSKNYFLKAEKLIKSVLSTDLSEQIQLNLSTQSEHKNDINPTKKRKLVTDGLGEDLISDIMKGEMLSDVHIDLTQCLLKRQFPNLPFNTLPAKEG